MPTHRWTGSSSTHPTPAGLPDAGGPLDHASQRRAEYANELVTRSQPFARGRALTSWSWRSPLLHIRRSHSSRAGTNGARDAGPEVDCVVQMLPFAGGGDRTALAVSPAPGATSWLQPSRRRG